MKPPCSLRSRPPEGMLSALGAARRALGMSKTASRNAVTKLSHRAGVLPERQAVPFTTAIDWIGPLCEPPFSRDRQRLLCYRVLPPSRKDLHEPDDQRSSPRRNSGDTRIRAREA